MSVKLARIQLPMKMRSLRKAKQDAALPHLVEASDQDEDSDSKVGGAGTAGGNGTLFDVFHWSEKDNVDEEKEQKKKLNARKVQLKTNSNHVEADNVSLPSSLSTAFVAVALLHSVCPRASFSP